MFPTNKLCRYIFLISILFFIEICAKAQTVKKISCNFSIKEKTDSLHFSLIRGKLLYDRISQETILHTQFPVNETWKIAYDKITKEEDGKTVESMELPAVSNFSIFKIFFEGNLSNFGLKNSNYQVVEVKKEEDQILSIWEQKQKKKDNIIYRITTSVKNGELFGVAFFSQKGTLLKKQLFTDYTLVGIGKFPQKISEITYKDGKEIYKIITFGGVTY